MLRFLTLTQILNPLRVLAAGVSIVLLTDCSGGKGGGGVNVFTLQDDITLGNQVEQEVHSDPAQYPILNPAQYPATYRYLDSLVINILNSGQVQHVNDFTWRVDIVQSDSTLNAFCAPGGYIVVYTGIIKYLDDPSSLAGVLGHEIAHADRRHVTQELTKVYGVEALAGIVLGQNPGLLTQIAEQLLFLKFSRENEAEADKYSVIYLCPTQYRADGAATFFQKLIAQQQAGNTPEFLSDHPSPENRVQAIEQEAQLLNCGEKSGPSVAAYRQFVNTLP